MLSFLMWFVFVASPAPIKICTLSLHDALPIFAHVARGDQHLDRLTGRPVAQQGGLDVPPRPVGGPDPDPEPAGPRRSEEHTSELQSRRDLVCRLLLENKKKDTRDYLAAAFPEL